MKVALSNSGGKDSYLTLRRAKSIGLKPVVSITMLNDELPLSRSHAIPPQLLSLQAENYGLATLFQPTSWALYEDNFLLMLKVAKKQFGIEGVVFGDRCFQSNKEWGLRMCEEAGLLAFHPIWDLDPQLLWHELLAEKVNAFICSCQPHLKTILGRFLDQEIIDYLDQEQADIFGENGEFHSFVTNGIAIENYVHDKVQIENYCFVRYHV